MIYIDSNTTHLFVNLFENGEAVNTTSDYVLKFVAKEQTQTIQSTQKAINATERYFRFTLPDLSTSKDGLYHFAVLSGSTEIYTEDAYISLKEPITYSSNSITNTYVEYTGA